MKMQFIRRTILCCHMKEATYSFNARFTRFVLLPPLRYYSTCRNFWNNVHDSDGWKLSTRPLPFLVRMRNIKSAPIVSTNLKSCFPVPKGGGGGQGLSQGAQQRVTFERPCSSTTISRATKEVLSGKFRGYSSVGWVGNNEIDEGVSRNNVAVKGTGKQLPPSI